jgi:L-malate glycosyltransferase
MTPERIRLAYCIDRLDVGGSELNAVRTAESLDPGRFDLRVFHLKADGPLYDRYRALRIPMTHVSISNLYSPATQLKTLELARALRGWGAHVLQTHDVYTNILAIPVSRLVSRSRIVASRRWWDYSPRPLLPVLNRSSYRFAHKVLANSESVGRMLEEEESVPRSKIFVSHNFLDDHYFNTPPAAAVAAKRALWNVPSGAFLAGIVARLVPVKQQETLLRALALLDESYHAVLVGDGPERRGLEQAAANLGLARRVHFAGELREGENLHGYFDVSVLCSSSEGSPNSIIEALAVARPVIATPVGGVVDLIRDGETGLLTPVGKPDRLASALRALRHDEALGARLGSAGLAVAKSRHRRQPVIEHLSSFYESLATVAR